MDLPLFHPHSTQTNTDDKIAQKFLSVSHYILVAVFGLLPLLFVPSTYMPFSSGKILFVSIALSVALLFMVVGILKRGSLQIRYPLILLGVWSIAAATLVSALLSGDVRDSLFGDGLGSYTAFFAFLMALLVTMAMSFVSNKQAVVRLYAVLIFSAIVVSIFHIVRLIFGADTFAFGIFTNATASPVGSWNGLAIFYGLIVLLVLLAMYQLPLSRVGRYGAFGVMIIALGMLTIINFYPAWWIMAAVAAVFCIYTLASHLWRKTPREENTSQPFEVLVATVLLLVISVIFILAGSRISSFIGEQVGVSYFEVRPSLMATVSITETVYSEDLLFGAGSNRFIDSWRMHKNPAINQTIFWNSPFDSGFSYVQTVLVGTGLLGAAAYLLFFVGLIWSGFRFIVRANAHDRFWHFIGTSSLVASVYFWIMALVYVPPPTIMLLAALTTGIFIASYIRLFPGPSLTLSVDSGRLYGIALIICLVVAFSGVSYVTYAGANQMLAVYQFNRILNTVAEGETLDSIDDRLVGAFEISRNDAFAAQIALHQLSEMRGVLASGAEANASQQQAFQSSATRAIEAAQTAIELDPTSPYNHQLLGQIYSALALVGVEGAADRARESFNTASRYDPHNPVLDLLDADLALGQNNIAGARSRAEAAVQKKGNYTEALFFLAQLDIREGNTERAIIIVNGIAQLEPNNPARRYQLGILLASTDRLDEAVAAFEQAVALDAQYANARYFLALGYAEQGRTEEAIEQLRVVRELNESNVAVDALIEQLQTNGSLDQSLTTSEVVPERDPNENLTEEDLDNDLVTSPNPVPSENEAEEVTAEEQ